LHHSQKIVLQDEQQVTISLEVFITQELVMKILSYGSEVKVIAPTQLAEKIKVDIMKMQDLYK
jgi:predicted DNA-binding transcriptional regulator YafY